MNKIIFDLFDQICQIPRTSCHEEKISQWLVDFAIAHHIAYERDNALNVIMRVPATPGSEAKPGVILQTHMDMVGEKDGDVSHNFLTDPIQTYIEGDFVRAKGTTLGGDDGIGMAMALAVLIDPELPHPAIEALFTVDEESGMTGANALQEGKLSGHYMLNLDSEDDGQIFIGCSGDVDTEARMHYQSVTPEQMGIQPTEWFAFHVAVKGLLGGHSGADIHLHLANANKVIVNFLQSVVPYNMQLAMVNGGNLRNAIAREAEAIFAVPASVKHEVIAAFNCYQSQFEQEYATDEPNKCLTLSSCPMPESFIPQPQAHAMIAAMVACPHGVLAMSQEMPGLVETSTNLASMKMKEDYVEVVCSHRSAKWDEQHAAKDRVRAVLATAFDDIRGNMGYPGWNPNPNSPLLAVTRQAYVDLFNAQPQVLAIHAGLECGLFLTKYPDLDMVSIGPQIYGAHTPQERLSISSTDRCYQWVCRILQMLA
ncbi:MAG: aminoacyl-histidine dipeptidase [Paludibacteraceae bacterium]|nr:aminoacyl-histidine dipeptidase [Paludibacteraceae bacterium]